MRAAVCIGRKRGMQHHHERRDRLNPSEGALRRGEAATWGQRSDAEPTRAAERPRMRLVGWRLMRKGSLRGFATVELPIGLKIHDVPVLISSGKPWAALPSKPQIDKEGRHKTDVNGKAAYVLIFEWKDRDLSDRFSQAVVALVRAEYPDDLGAP
jgi:hypothetical protein